MPQTHVYLIVACIAVFAAWIALLCHAERRRRAQQRRELREAAERADAERFTRWFFPEHYRPEDWKR